MTSKPEISRVNRSKRQAMAVYDQLSRWYDWFSTSSEWPMTLLGLARLNVKTGGSVLEIGFGTGNALLVLAEDVGDSGKVVGVDISRGMFGVAREKNCLRKSDPSSYFWTSRCCLFTLRIKYFRCDFYFLYT
jgi:demethylmenaquinone methyltransferase/2-methoxy-6-polyprenyl-1,4-benzoquinol methylase